MPRYYFHLRDDEGVVPDCEGAELLNLEDARSRARQKIHDHFAQYIQNPNGVSSGWLDIAFEYGVIESIKIRDGLN